MDEYEPRTLGERIVRLRKLRNWTQEQLAERVGLHSAHMSRLERDKMRPKSETLARLAEVFSVSMDDLVDRAVETPTELNDEALLRGFNQAQQLDPEDRRLVLRIVAALLTKKRVEQAIQQDA